MQELKAFSESNTFEKEYLPCEEANGMMVCVCGYELLKEDEDTWRCSGGGHVYRLSDGSVTHDKFGNTYIKRRRDNE